LHPVLIFHHAVSHVFSKAIITFWYFKELFKVNYSFLCRQNNSQS